MNQDELNNNFKLHLHNIAQEMLTNQLPLRLISEEALNTISALAQAELIRRNNYLKESSYNEDGGFKGVF